MHLPRLQQLTDVSLLKTASYQASFFETVRCHPGFGGGDTMVVTLPPTNGMSDQGKWCRINISLTTSSKFVRVVGFGGPNAASIKKFGKKGIAKYKKQFQGKYKKFYYFGDGINDLSLTGDPNTNLYAGLTMSVAEQSCLFVWDGVSNWWTTETNGFGYMVGNEETQDQGGLKPQHIIDIHNKGIVGQNPPTRVLDAEHSLFGAERFALNEQIFFSVPIEDFWRGPLSTVGGGGTPLIQLDLLLVHGAGAAGDVTFEAKIIGSEADEDWSAITPTTKTGLITVTAVTTITKELIISDIQDAIDANPDAHYLMFRLKCTVFGGTRTSIDLLGARLHYQKQMPTVRFFEGVQTY